MAKYTAPEEISSESKVTLWMYAFDFFFILIYLIVSYLIRDMVVSKFKIFYAIFSLVCAIAFTLPSPFNKKRRFFQSLLIFIHKDRSVYHPLTGKEKESN